MSLTASNVTFSIFVRLRAANNTSSNKSKPTTAGAILVSKIFIFRSVRTRRGQLTLPYILRADLFDQLTWLALGHDQAGGSRSAEQVTAL